MLSSFALFEVCGQWHLPLKILWFEQWQSHAHVAHQQDLGLLKYEDSAGLSIQWGEYSRYVFPVEQLVTHVRWNVNIIVGDICIEDFRSNAEAMSQLSD